MTPLDVIEKFSSDAKAEISPDILAFSLREALLPHNRFKQALCAIAELHYYSLRNEVGGGLLITGPSGVGKTSLMKHYKNLFPRSYDTQITQIPVLLITPPSSPTVRSFAEAVLQALGDPIASRGSAEEKTIRIYEWLKKCKVELILIDEFQHFYYTNTMMEFRRITDWFKNLISLSGIAVVLCGLPESEIVLKSSEQLDRRFSSKHTITAFKLENQKDFLEFRAILRRFEKELPLRTAIPLYEANLARRFLIASNGLLDYVRKILEASVVAANKAGYQILDLNAYAEGFKNNIWKDVPDRLNPFHPDSPLRPLNKRGEPYYAGDKRYSIGSPLARRSIVVASE